MSVENLEALWERLAAALDEAGPERETLFLSKLALLCANEIADRERMEQLIARALQDLA